MAEHERPIKKKQDDIDQKHRIRQQEPESSFDRFLAYEQGISPVTETPFRPQMDQHASLLAQAHSNERRANLAIHLQQTYGNRYVQRLLDSVLQRQVEEEEEEETELQTKPLLQRQAEEGEEEEEEVMTKPAAGQSAPYLADKYSGLHRGLGIQRYIEVDDTAGDPWRYGEGGKTALYVSSEEGGQELFATSDLIMQANGKLAQAGQNGSFIRLTSGNQLQDGLFPFQDALPDLRKVEPKHVVVGPDPSGEKLRKINQGLRQADDGTSGQELALWADCGRASRAVMGIGQGAAMPRAGAKIGGAGKVSKPSLKPSTFTTIYKEAMPSFMLVAGNRKFLKKGVHYDKQWEDVSWKFWKISRRKIMKTPADDKEAKKMYWELGEEGRRAFDEQTGINLAADPEIGGAYTLVTEKEMPGFQKTGKTWNFHWAGVVMKDGANNITLENYAVSFGSSNDPVENAKLRKMAYDYVNRDWNFQMYGTAKKGQTFHEQHLKTGTHGTRGSTFGVRS